VWFTFVSAGAWRLSAESSGRWLPGCERGGSDGPAVLPSTDRSYLLTGTGDTFDKIVEHCAEWDNFWNRWPDVGQKIQNEKIIEMWRAGLAQLNPQLPKTGNVKEGTRVQLLTYAETENRLKALEKTEQK